MTYFVNMGYIHIEISTHTLTWSVTFSIELLCKLDFISTHTLTWSVTKHAGVYYA